MKKKSKILIIVLALILIGLIPIKQHLKDGGTVVYQAILYSYIDYNVLTDEDDVYLCGKEFRIFPINWIRIGDYNYDKLEKVKL